MVGERFQRAADLLIRRRSERRLRVQHGRPHVERNQRKAILLAQRAENGFHGGDLELPGGFVTRGRRVDDDRDVGSLLLHGRPVHVGRVAREHVVGAVFAGGKTCQRERLAVAIELGLELKRRARRVARTTHGDELSALLDAGIRQRCDLHLGAVVAEIDAQRELTDPHRLTATHRVDVVELAIHGRAQLDIAEHYAPGAAGAHRVNARAIRAIVDVF